MPAAPTLLAVLVSPLALPVIWAKASEVLPRVMGALVVSTQALSPLAVPSETNTASPAGTSAEISASLARAQAPAATT